MNIPFLNRDVSSIHAAALILGVAGLSSRLLGLLRDRLLAARFGAGAELDVYYASFQLPDVIYSILLAGAASAAVLPVFIERDRESPVAAERFLSNLLTVFAVIATAITVAVIFAAPGFVRLIAPGFSAAKLEVTARMARIMLSNAVLLGIAGIFSSALQARQRFFVFALPPIVYNLGIIGAIFFAVPTTGVEGLAYGVVAGGALQAAVQLPALRSLGFKFRPSFNLADAGLRKVVRTALPRVAAIGMSHFTLTALLAVASLLAAGSISAFRFAANLLYVPVGLFGVSWALAAFPKLSSASSGGDGGTFSKHMALGMRAVLFWVLPASALAIVLRAHIVRVVLGSGVFDWEDTRLVAAILAVFAVAIVTESLLPLVLRAFYALGRTAEPLLWDIAGSVFTVTSAVGLGIFFRAQPDILSAVARILRIGDLPSVGIIAIAMAFALGSVVNISFLFLSLRRVSRKRFGTAIPFEAVAALTMAGAAVLAGAAAYLALIPFPALVSTDTFFGIALQGVAAGIAGVLVYAFVLRWQKNPEMLSVIASFRQRLLNPAKAPRVFETEAIDGDGVK